MSQLKRAAGTHTGRSRAVLALAAALLVITVASCSDDNTTSSNDNNNSEDTVAEAANLLGPDNVATGEPVKIGVLSDGATASFDNTDELRAGQATAEFYNQKKGGIAGRPIQVVTCETGGDPSGATDCANKFVTDGVVAVTLSQSAATADVWKVLNASGVPTFFTQANGEDILADANTSFVVFNPQVVLTLPISTAEDAGSNKISFVVIDVPQAVEIIEQNAKLLADAGMEFDIVRVPVGTADMTTQMQQVASSGAGVVQVVGNDAFCIAAFQGLRAVQYEGQITAVSQCITDATREALPTELEGISVISTLALGANGEATYELYKAVMTEYGQAVEDVDNNIAMGGYSAVAALATALQDLTGEVSTQTVAAAIKAMPESEYPGGGGVKYQCGGSAVPASPAICTNQWLRAVLDASGVPSTYTVEDSSALFNGGS